MFTKVFSKIQVRFIGAAAFPVLFFLAGRYAAAFPGLPLVPCGRQGTAPCNACDFFKLIKNLIDFGIAAASIFAVLLFVISGILFMIGGAQPALQSRAKSLFKNTIYGLLVLFSSWLITNTFIKTVQGENARPEDKWYQFTCTTTVAQPPEVTLTPTPEITPPPVGQINVCELCPAYRPDVTCGGQPIQCVGPYVDTGIPVNNTGATCPYAASSMAQKLQQLRSINSEWVISEGQPPTASHNSSKHCDGRAVDIIVSGFPRADQAASIDSEDMARLRRVCDAVKQVGFVNFLNEYYYIPQSRYGELGSCPLPRNTQRNTGGHLHIEVP